MENYMAEGLRDFTDALIHNVFPILLVAAGIALVVTVILKIIKGANKIVVEERKVQDDAVYHSKYAVASSDVDGNYRVVNGFLVKLDQEAQGGYMPGKSGYEQARNNGIMHSVIFRDASGLQKLLDEKAGSGDFVAPNKEKVNFGQVIGQYMDPDTKAKLETTVGVIHYTSDGVYIVPARPNTRREING
ncbi:MAG: hypothetical protein IJ747_09490 [Lachnospiraceae bacterium]|nr:hypothetical protein [Lachnospiraceae bacterium]